MQDRHSPGDASPAQAQPLRIGFVALNAYPVIEPSAAGTFGGIETRSWTWARALARREDAEVHFVIRHAHALRKAVYENVQLHLWLDRLYPLRESVLSRVTPLAHFPWLKVHQPSLSLLWELPLLAGSKLLRGGRRDPRQPHPLLMALPVDQFLTFGVQGNSATVIASAHQQGKPAVLFLGSDGDLDERYAGSDGFVSVYRDQADVCRWVLAEADLILAQTERQQLLLRERFARDSILVPNPIDAAAWERNSRAAISDRRILDLGRYALWVGRADPEHKRPQLCIDLARLCPEVTFLMILNKRDDRVEQQVRQTAPPNVVIVPAVPFEQMPAVFRRAAVLVNTSSLEGFPNTYLQAALAGVPVASLVVEPLTLARYRLGVCTDGNLDQLAHFISECWNGGAGTDPEFAKAAVTAEHDLGQLAARLLAALRQARPPQSH